VEDRQQGRALQDGSTGRTWEGIPLEEQAVPAPAVPDFRQHLEVETPEHVVLDYEIAGLGSRALAAIIDTLILIAWSFALLVVFGLLALQSEVWASALFALAYFASLWGYFAFFEGFGRGQTPGKRRLGIRVVRDTGHPVSFGSAAVRNLLRAADFLPPPYLLGGILVALHPRGKRLGDMVAGTVVVRDRPAEAPENATVATTLAQEDAGAPELSEEEFRILREFSERAGALAAEPRARLSARLAQRFAERYPNRPADPALFLAELYRDELARRRGRFSARGTAPAIARGSFGSVAERMVARKGERWDSFQRLAERASQEGLDSFAATELPEFAARYREVAADLARSRTYGADQATQARLERLVAAGHNALYRDERNTLGRIWHVIIRECPAAIVEARRYVLIAFLAFALPAAAGFFVLRERPALAAELLPDAMLERAEAGAARTRMGKGYVEIEASERPVIASTIITNNITVAFYCFAGGIFAGIGSLVLLAYNGLEIGAVSAHFANLGLLGYLWRFIIGHGVLELFAIWVAGAAGFLLGKALIAPGDLTRSDALVLRGRLAVRMIGAVIVMLLLAGSIEGFVSTSEGGSLLRLAVSGVSGLFLVLYLLNGAMYLRKSREPSAVSHQISGLEVRPATGSS
jgi:uncharacterized membrane protein SpoIIM required for sporulation/uncharacterized RDD family membrane protein YckC